MDTKNGTYYTFSNGLQVKIKRIPPFIALQLRNDFPPPKPPTQVVEYPDGKKRVEENPAHPDYVEAMRIYGIESELRMRKLVLKRGLEWEMTDAHRAELKAVADNYREDFGKELDISDETLAYLSYVAIQTNEEIERLIALVLNQSQPTEETVKAVQDSFQGDVQGS